MNKDLFSTAEIELLREEITDLKSSVDSIRKGIFARHDQIKRDLEKIKEIISSKKEFQIDFCDSKIAHIGM